MLDFSRAKASVLFLPLFVTYWPVLCWLAFRDLGRNPEPRRDQQVDGRVKIFVVNVEVLREFLTGHFEVLALMSNFERERIQQRSQRRAVTFEPCEVPLSRAVERRVFLFPIYMPQTCAA